MSDLGPPHRIFRPPDSQILPLSQITALRHIKGASDVPADTQVLGGSMDDYRSNLVLGLVQSGELDAQKDPAAIAAHITEQQVGFALFASRVVRLEA